MKLDTLNPAIKSNFKLNVVKGQKIAILRVFGLLKANERPLSEHGIIVVFSTENYLSNEVL